MNLPRDKAIEAMDVITSAGYSAHVEAAVIPNFSTEVLYRVSVLALSFEDIDLRALCDLAESIGLHCRMSLQAIRFEAEAHQSRAKRAVR